MAEPDPAEVMQPAETPSPEDDRIYSPRPDEKQLTARAVVTGCLLGGVVGAMNIYFGLKTGWSVGGSLIAAILGFSVWATLHALLPVKALSPLETNITQTSGSAAGAMASTAGLLSSIPALGLLGLDLAWWELMLWALSIGYLGVFFAVPLRNQMVVAEKLRFPTGTATAETIVSMYAEGSQAIAQARTLFIWGIIAGVFTLAAYFIVPLGHPPIDEWLGYNPDPAATNTMLAAGFGIASAWGFSLLISPLMFGAGILIGPRVGISLLLGAIVGWAFLGPYVRDQGWATGPIMSYETGPRGWILWPGVAIMVADALTNLALSWKTILNTFKGGKKSDDIGMESKEERVPNSWWLIGLGLGSILAITVAQFVFGIDWWMTMIAIAMSSVLAMIAVRSVGETDINPTGGMGKVTQLVFGGVAPGQPITNLLAAGVTSAGASQAGDMMQDLKTGRMLGAAPRKQIIAQCIGIAAGIPVVVLIFSLFNNAYEIGIDEEMPAPAAQAWRAMAEVLTQGFDAMPTHAEWAVLAGLIFGTIFPILRRVAKPIAPFLPSGLAFGIAFIVPAYYSVAMFLGSMMLVIWRKSSPKTAKVYAIAVASGLVAGEGLMGIVKAVLTLFNVPPWISG